jgi:hypothetical protein
MLETEGYSAKSHEISTQTISKMETRIVPKTELFEQIEQ